MADPAPSSRRELEEQIIERARRNPAFRAALVRDARSALAREFDLEFPDDLEIEILEETASIFYLVLSLAPAPDLDRELTDAELEAVAAGGDPFARSFWFLPPRPSS